MKMCLTSHISIIHYFFQWFYQCWIMKRKTYNFSKTALIPFLCTGMTLATFSIDGNTADEKDRLNMSARWVEISCFNSFKNLVGKLFGTVDL